MMDTSLAEEIASDSQQHDGGNASEKDIMTLWPTYLSAFYYRQSNHPLADPDIKLGSRRSSERRRSSTMSQRTTPKSSLLRSRSNG